MILDVLRLWIFWKCLITILEWEHLIMEAFLGKKHHFLHIVQLWPNPPDDRKHNVCPSCQEEKVLEWLIGQKTQDTIEQVTDKVLERLVEEEDFLAGKTGSRIGDWTIKPSVTRIFTRDDYRQASVPGGRLPTGNDYSFLAIILYQAIILY